MAEAKPKDEVLAAGGGAGGGDDDDEEEVVEEELKQEQKDENLLKACKENNYDEAALWLAKQASPTCERDSWNPLLWAASNGNEEIVRLLIKHNACAPYLTSTSDQDGSDAKGATTSASVVGEEEYDPFVKPKDAQKVGKYTPLAWASYKGHYKVVWILLKQNMSPLDNDMHGNTAVH
jgi:ankyrin repeat protein